MSSLLPSCGTLGEFLYEFQPDSHYGAFKGVVRNFEYAGQNEEVVYQKISGKILHMPNGGHVHNLCFTDPDFTLCFFIPDSTPVRTIYTTDSENVTVKLIRGCHPLTVGKIDQEKEVERANYWRRNLGVELKGNLSIRYDSNIDFEFVLDLASDSGIAFEGTFLYPFERVRLLQWPGT